MTTEERDALLRDIATKRAELDRLEREVAGVETQQAGVRVTPNGPMHLEHGGVHAVAAPAAWAAPRVPTVPNTTVEAVRSGAYGKQRDQLLVELQNAEQPVGRIRTRPHPSTPLPPRTQTPITYPTALPTPQQLDVMQQHTGSHQFTGSSGLLALGDQGETHDQEHPLQHGLAPRLAGIRRAPQFIEQPHGLPGMMPPSVVDRIKMARTIKRAQAAARKAG